MDLSKGAQEKVRKLQQYEQNVQALNLQSQQLEKEMTEIDSAISALEDKATKDVFKIIGNIMVTADKIKLKADLNNQKKKIEIRISALEKQQEQIRQVAEAMQAEVLKTMKKWLQWKKSLLKFMASQPN